MMDLDTIPAPELRQQIQKAIRETAAFNSPPDFSEVENRAERLFNLLLAAEDRRQNGVFPVEDVRALKTAIDALPQNATKAGATKDTLTALFKTLHWREYRRSSF